LAEWTATLFGGGDFRLYDERRARAASVERVGTPYA